MYKYSLPQFVIVLNKEIMLSGCQTELHFEMILQPYRLLWVQYYLIHVLKAIRPMIVFTCRVE